jgi:4-diphosphocytidyl-2-C-methyl-D-erythritol kinase
LTSLWRETAPGKVNLCLFLGGSRPDGRHELVTLFESVSLADDMVVERSFRDEVIAPGVEGANLVDDALAGLRRRGWAAPPTRIEITKRIPIAAGMGGGSADAAALLRLAPQLAPIDDADRTSIAHELGADVPSQLDPGLNLGTGAGDIVDPRPPLAPHAFVIVPLTEQLSTAAVYAEADRLGLARDAEELEARLRELEVALGSAARLPEPLLVNDLEPAARSLCPAIDAALEAVSDAGADRALVCGSGPTVAGLFWDVAAAGPALQSVSARFPASSVATPVSSHASGTIPTR